jgi:hypothetical protein
VNELDCPLGTLAYGMTLAIPQSLYWRSPELGPIPDNYEPLPLSVCLLCHQISDNPKKNREIEALSNDNRNVASYQTCIGKGNLQIQISFIFFREIDRVQ